MPQNRTRRCGAMTSGTVLPLAASNVTLLGASWLLGMRNLLFTLESANERSQQWNNHLVHRVHCVCIARRRVRHEYESDSSSSPFECVEQRLTASTGAKRGRRLCSRTCMSSQCSRAGEQARPERTVSTLRITCGTLAPAHPATLPRSHRSVRASRSAVKARRRSRSSARSAAHCA